MTALDLSEALATELRIDVAGKDVSLRPVTPRTLAAWRRLVARFESIVDPMGDAAAAQVNDIVADLAVVTGTDRELWLDVPWLQIQTVVVDLTRINAEAAQGPLGQGLMNSMRALTAVLNQINSQPQGGTTS